MSSQRSCFRSAVGDAISAIGCGAARRARLVIGCWLVALVASVALLPHLLGALHTPPLAVPGSDSARGQELVTSGFPELGDEQAIAVFHSDSLEAVDPAFELAMAVGTTALRSQDGVSLVQSDPPNARSHRDPHSAYAVVGLAGDENARVRAAPAHQQALEEATADASGGRVTASLISRSAIFADLRDTDMADLRTAESIALPIAALVLLVGLGTVGSTAVALAFGGIAVGVGTGLLSLLSFSAPVSSMVLTTAVTIGWGLGLDYAVLVLLRYRDEMLPGTAAHTAVGRTMSTAGRTVCFSSCAVVVCLSGLLVVRSPMFREFLIGVAVMALVTFAAAVTLLPALLASTGRWLEAGRMPWKRAPVPEAGRWARWTRHLMRRPWWYLVGAGTLLVLAAIPAQQMRLGLDIDRDALAGSTMGQGVLHIEQDTVAGLTGTTRVVLPRAAGEPGPDVRPAVAALEADPQVSSVNALDNGADLMTLIVVPTTPVDSPRTAELIERMRAELPAQFPVGQELLVTGAAALTVDLQNEVVTKLPWIVAVVLALSGVLLFLFFRSVAVPVKAVALNVLAAGATFGLLALVFLGGSDVASLNFYVPAFVFVTLFALSMDYEVFLVRRIQEDYHRHGDNVAAVARGVQSTARPITLAAAVMIAVFAGLLTASRVEVRQIGFAMATAIAIDATLIRLVMVPAAMQLLGRYNWWAPGPLRRRRNAGPGVRGHEKRIGTPVG